MAFPTGVNFILPVIINKELVSGALDNFLYQVDLSAYITQISDNVAELSEANIAVYDPTIDDILPKYADTRSISDDKFIFYFSGSTSNTVNRTFYICFGVNLDVVNSIETFSNSGFTHYWGLNELSGTSALPYIGSRTGSTTDNVSLGNVGKFMKCASNTGVGKGKIAFDNEIIGSGDRTISFLYNFIGFVSGIYARIISNNKFILVVASIGNKFLFVSNGAAIDNATNAQSSTNSLTTGSWNLLTITRTSAGVTNFYVNGVLSGTADQSSGTPASGTSNMVMLNSVGGTNPFKGSIDEVGFTNNILSTDYITTRYNQYFNTSFWSYGSPMVIADPKKSYRYQYSISQ